MRRTASGRSLSALGLCVGCKIYGFLARRGWIAVSPDGESCADGYCEPRVKATVPAGLDMAPILLAACRRETSSATG